jgi:hypothetical protein
VPVKGVRRARRKQHPEHNERRSRADLPSTDSYPPTQDHTGILAAPRFRNVSETLLNVARSPASP